MKRFFLLFVVLAGMLSLPMRSLAAEDKAFEEALRRSQLDETNLNPDKTGYPCPFVKTGTPIVNPVGSTAISTGYYFVDSDVNGDAGAPWRPDPANTPNVNFESSRWVRIFSGPNQAPRAYFESDTNINGQYYFRNPTPGTNGQIDSTDDAFAGPMPIRFEFYFNGIRYDSFYVSTNGLVGFSNRRYTYAKNAQTGKAYRTGYDKYSMDWFATGRGRQLGTDGKADNSKAITDPIPDNFGYQFSALGNDLTNAKGGYRVAPDPATPLGAVNDATLFPPDLKQAFIAPLFSDLQVSVFSKTNQQIDDFGQVWFKRSTNMDSLTIYFSNLIGVHGKKDPNNPGNPPTDLGINNRFDIDKNTYVSASFSVVITRLDSSISVNFHKFDGSPVLGQRNIPPTLLFRFNSAIGVRGFARHVNWNNGTIPNASYPWAAEFEQYTHYSWNYPKGAEEFPYLNLAIKFKQYKNIFRVVDIQYRVQSPNPNDPSGFSVKVPTTKANGYELLAGDTRLGSLQPVAIFENLSNDIQGPDGVNYVAQPLQFTAMFKITNEASDRIVWANTMVVDSLSLAATGNEDPPVFDDPINMKVKYVNVSLTSGNFTTVDNPFPGANNLNGIPPYGFAQIHFGPFSPSEANIDEIGRLKGTVSIDPYRPGPERVPFNEMWNFDNTKSVNFFSVKRLEPDFYDDATHFHMIGGKSMPSTLKWVNYEGEVINGEDACYYPLSPRGDFVAANKVDFGFNSVNPVYDTKIKSPVIKLNRKTLDDSEPAGWAAASNMAPPRPAYTPNGDELRSFPIDMRNNPYRITYGASVSFSLQRGVKRSDFARDWADQTMLCPEIRAITNAKLNTNPVGNAPWTEYAGASSKYFDMICLEYSSQKIDATLQTQKVVNISDDADWRWMPVKNGTPITDNSAYSVYGGVGYQVGYLESDKNIPLKALDGIRCDILDDGIDYDFKRCVVPIPDTIINAPLEGAKNFRFRFKVRAIDGKACINCIDDDDDPFLVDNIKIVLRKETADLEVSSAKIVWPYAIAPISQAIAIPVKVKISNNSTVQAPSFKIKVKIYRKGEENDTTNKKAVYCRVYQLPFLKTGSDISIPMPNWDARGCGDGQFVIKAMVIMDGGDADSRNDTTTTDFALKFGEFFSYIKDETPIGTNDVINEIPSSVDMGRGLSFPAYALGGYGTYSKINGTPFAGSYEANQKILGCGGSNMTGEIAMKFELFQADTIHGFNAFFGGQNLAEDQISYQIYKDVGSFVPSNEVDATELVKYRGHDDKTGNIEFDKYTTYLYNTVGSGRTSVVLPVGTYWVGVTQRTFNGFMLGASKTRSGMRTTLIYSPDPTQDSYLGDGGHPLIIDKNFRVTNINGSLINNNCFAAKTNAASSSWVQFFPTTGNPAYAHLDHFGNVGPSGVLARGSWIPLLRPYFGNRKNTVPFTTQDCDNPIAVEVFGFKGQARTNTVDLYWNTASENNNKYFVIERKQAGDDESAWKQIGTVNGAGNSVVAKSYVYNDTKVKANSTYNYRLTSVDIDGKYDCRTSDIVTVELAANETTVSCGPNPFSTNTAITVNTPQRANVVVEISDIFGNVVKTVVENNVSGEFKVEWNGDDQSGNTLSSGTYIYKAKVGEQTFTGKISLVR